MRAPPLAGGDGGEVSRRRLGGFADFLGRREMLPLLLLTPVLIFFIVWNVIPTLWLLGLGFYRFSLTSGRPPIFCRPV